MLPIFSARHAIRYDSLQAQAASSESRHQGPRWKRVKGIDGFYFVPEFPPEMIPSHAEDVCSMTAAEQHATDAFAEAIIRARAKYSAYVAPESGLPGGPGHDSVSPSLASGHDEHRTAYSPFLSLVRAPSLPAPLPFLSRGFSTSPQLFAMPALKPHAWISLWFLVTVPVIFWDVGYCFMRPRSMKGGDLHWIWSPYSIYQNVDLVYGVKTYEDGDGFTNAQSLLNVIETLMNIVYLYLAHIANSPAAIVVGFSSAVMTLSKTVLYWAQEYFCGYCAVGHNSLKDLIVYWILPNGLWIVIPAMIVRVFGQEIAGQLYAADRAAKKAALEKRR